MRTISRTALNTDWRGHFILLAVSLLLLAACGGGGGGGGGGNGNGGNPTTVTVSGSVNYEFVPPNTACQGLNFASTFSRPIRGATVQLISSTNAVLGTTVSSDNGSYSFPGIAQNVSAFLRVRAELKRQGSPSWDIEVRDNYDASATPPPIAVRPLYVLDGPTFSTGTNGVLSQSMTARTGWDGASYSSARSAAPFAILDTLYGATQYVLQADATASFPPLDAFWSVNNSASSTITGTTLDERIALGELGGAFYRPGLQQLFLTGADDGSTTEFDDHVVLHEWSHYFEDTFSRSDNRGGSHNIGESLEASFAFSEGWGYAVAAMVTGNPIYCSTGAPGTNAGFGLQTETGEYGAAGWFNEWGIGTILYDLIDTDVDGTDNSSIGWPPIYNAMRSAHASSDAFTTIFTFATELRSSLSPQDQAFLDSQLDRENIVSGTDLDIWATNETNAAGVPTAVPRNVEQTVLPIYIDYVADGTVMNICVDSYLDPPRASDGKRDGNNIGEDAHLRISVPVTDAYDVAVITTTPQLPDDPTNDFDQSDPDIYLYAGPNEIIRGWSGTPNSETFTTPELQAGTVYRAFLEEWMFEADEAPSNFPEVMCFDVSFTPTP